MYQLIFSCLKGCFWTPLNPWNASQRCKELYGVVHQHLSHSWHWISFIIRSFWGAKKKRTTWVSSASIVLNALLETSELTTIETSQCWKNPGNCLILENCERSEYNFFAVFGARIQIFERISGSTRMMTASHWLVWKFPFNLWTF